MTTPQAPIQAVVAHPDMLAWALRYAAIGYHIFPCHEPLHGLSLIHI